MKLDPNGFFERVCKALVADNAPEVARKLGISKHAVYLWAEGKMPGLSGLRSVLHISELSGVSLYWLLTGTEDPTASVDSQTHSGQGQLLVTFSDPVIQVLREIAEQRGVSLSAAAEQATIDELKSRGLLREPGKEITVVLYGDREPDLIPVRVVGEIADGAPLKTFTGLRMERVAAELRPLEKGAQGLKVAGDSFSEIGIYDGDLIVFAPQSEAANGQTAIVVIDDEALTIKAVFKNPGAIMLRSRNLEVPDIILPEARVRVMGVVLGIQRSGPEPVRESNSTKPRPRK